MWDIVLLVGLALLIVGLVKRKTGWGKAVALAGVAGVLAAVAFHGPEMADAFMEGYRAARND